MAKRADRNSRRAKANRAAERRVPTAAMSRRPEQRVPSATVPPWRNGLVLRALSVVVLALLGLGLFLTTPVFGVDEIVVIGANHLTSGEVAGLCGVSMGTNLLKVPTGAIRDRLEAHPRVESATVARRLPSRIVVTLVEREGVALLPAVDGYAELDLAGRPVELHRYIGALGLPVITGVTTQGLTLGSPISDARLTAALLCSSELGVRGRQAVGEVHLTREGELVLYTHDGIPVYFGLPTAVDVKVEAFLGVLPDLESGELAATYVDVRYPRFPVVGSSRQVIETFQWPGSDPDAELLGGP